jgi:SAM-dependent methyltransferase
MEESFWNDRYSRTESSYGNKPNEFLKESLLNLTPGTLLLPGEGEGRNAIFAAKQGWRVSAFDFSEVARAKALAHAHQERVIIEYEIGDLNTIALPIAHYDAIALVYIHLSERVRRHLHTECVKALKPGGTLILEAFSKNQLHYSSGGPKDVNLLYSVPELQEDFEKLALRKLEERIVNLNEGSIPLRPWPVSYS